MSNGTTETLKVLEIEISMFKLTSSSYLKD